MIVRPWRQQSQCREWPGDRDLGVVEFNLAVGLNITVFGVL